MGQERLTTGTIKLEETDGRATFRMIAGGVDACLRGEVPALVTRTETTTIIVPQQPMTDCESFAT